MPEHFEWIPVLVLLLVRVTASLAPPERILASTCRSLRSPGMIPRWAASKRRVPLQCPKKYLSGGQNLALHLQQKVPLVAASVK